MLSAVCIYVYVYVYVYVCRDLGEELLSVTCATTTCSSVTYWGGGGGRFQPGGVHSFLQSYIELLLLLTVPSVDY